MKELKSPFIPPLTRGTTDLSCDKVRTEKSVIVPYNKNLKETSRKLRKNTSEAERCLWKRLKLKHLGFIFHRQKPIGNYIADFYCSKAKLVIEVDGGYHAKADTAANDVLRDKIMHNLDLTVLRFSNSEVLNETDKVVEAIKKILLDSSFDQEDNISVHNKKL